MALTGSHTAGDAGHTADHDLIDNAILSLPGQYAPFHPRATSAAYAATVTPNSDTTDGLIIGALTGALTLAAPTGTPGDFQTLRIRFAQDGTGGRAITFNSAYRFTIDVTLALIPTAASAAWEMIFEWNAALSKWVAMAINRF